MFTEIEIASFVQSDAIKQEVLQLRKDFIQKEAPYMELEEHDFLSLIMLTPVIDLILLDKEISFWEEMKINAKARKMSKGGFVLSHDPVVYATKYYVKKFDEWKGSFYAALKVVIYTLVEKDKMLHPVNVAKDVDHILRADLMSAPYILVRFLSAFFVGHDEDVLKVQTVSRQYLDKVIEIGKRLELDEVPAYQDFLANYQVKK